MAPGLEPTVSQYWLTPVPALHVKVTDAPGRIDPHAGLVISALVPMIAVAKV